MDYSMGLQRAGHDWATFSWAEDTAENKETRAARMSRAETCRGERKSSEIQRFPAWALKSKYIRKLLRPKNRLKGVGGTTPEAPPGLGRAPSFSCQPEWKDFILHRARRRAFRRVSLVHGILQARTLEWVAIPFSRRPSQPRDWTQVSDIAGGSFTIWASREAHIIWAVRPN